MFYLPQQFEGLSPKRQKAIYDDLMAERNDAAMNAVVIGLKCLNQVYGMGLQSLAALSTSWGPDIVQFYKNGNSVRDGWPQGMSAGDLITDPLTRYADLSDRMMRQITAYFAQMRLEAQSNAYAIGIDTIRQQLHFGDTRIARLERQWLADLELFYRERETCEPQLRAWIEDIGFIWENGRLQAYRRHDNDRTVRKRTAEKMYPE